MIAHIEEHCPANQILAINNRELPQFDSHASPLDRLKLLQLSKSTAMSQVLLVHITYNCKTILWNERVASCK